MHNCNDCKYNGLIANYPYCAVNPTYYETYTNFVVKEIYDLCPDWQQISFDLLPYANIQEYLDAPLPDALKAEAMGDRFSLTQIQQAYKSILKKSARAKRYFLTLKPSSSELIGVR